MGILKDWREFLSYRKIKKSFEKDVADSNQSPWLDENQKVIPSWIGGMMYELEPKYIFHFERFMGYSKEDLAKRCAWNEIRKELTPKHEFKILRT